MQIKATDEANFHCHSSVGDNIGEPGNRSYVYFNTCSAYCLKYFLLYINVLGRITGHESKLILHNSSLFKDRRHERYTL